MGHDVTKTRPSSSRRQVRGAILLDESDNQTGIGTNPLPVGEVAATDLEGLGDIAVGTSQVAITITGTPTKEIRIRADVDNTGIIFIGKTGVLSDKTNDYVRLYAGDEHTFKYNDATNGLFAISDTAAQNINVGVLL